jgi:hypothetical protein
MIFFVKRAFKEYPRPQVASGQNEHSKKLFSNIRTSDVENDKLKAVSVERKL